MATNNTLPITKVLDLAGKFVVTHKGRWDHLGWETFLDKAQKTGITLDDDTKRQLGNLLEASKCLYLAAPPTPAKRARAVSTRKRTIAKS